MFNEVAQKIQELLSKGEEFAVAQVIDRIAPSSGKVGDKAIILPSGQLIGWIGGGCVRGIVIKEALQVIERKRYRRVRISPQGGTSESDNFKEYVMACQSEGTVEVLIEPVIPQPELVIIGKSNIARKLALLATHADFRVTAMGHDVDAHLFPNAVQVIDGVDYQQIPNVSNKYIIITTQGELDEEAVEQAMHTGSPYIGFVASKKKAEKIRQYLADQNISNDRISILRSPVGIDINAKLAGEVGISILAEIIAHFRQKSASDFIPLTIAEQSPPPAKEPKPSAFSDEYYINPVCQVPVSKKNPKHIIEYKGEKVYFCCDGCKVSFENNPAQYMTANK